MAATVNGAFEAALDQAPERVFVDFSGESYTYAGFDTIVEQLAAALQALGIEAGDRVVTVLDNGPVAVQAWLAVNRIGAIWVPINTSYKGEFLRHQVADSGARLVICEAAYLPRLATVRAGIPLVETVLHLGAAAEPITDGLPALPLAPALEGAGAARREVIRATDLAGLFYTAGTTGPSKGCMMSHEYMAHIGRRITEAADRQADEVMWTPLPLFHTAALSTVMSTLLLAGSASIAPRFSVSGFWAEIERSEASVAMVIATMIPLVAQAPDTPEMLRCRGQLRAVLGLPFPPDLQEVWRTRFGVHVAGFNAYGMTEVAMATIVPGGRGAKPGSSGRRHEWVDLRIFDDDDHEVGPGVVGEIVCRPLRPQTMFDGYWNRPEATLAQMRNLWFHTGDYGRFDEDGFLYFVDRKKDYLRRRGENISSFEMETAYLQHGAIAEVAVHAVFSELSEDDVKVTAILRDGEALEPAELFEWSIDKVPYFALPRYIEFRTQLPKNPVGRVLKYKLREEGCTPATWDREAAGVHVSRS